MQTPPHGKGKYDIVPRPTRVLYTSEQSHYHILPSSLQISTEFGTRESTVTLMCLHLWGAMGREGHNFRAGLVVYKQQMYDIF